MQYANRRFEEFLNDNFLEKYVLPPKKEFIPANSAMPTEVYEPHGCFTTTDFFSSHCHLSYKSVTTGVTLYIGGE
jgi:hypothetical protein